MLSNQSLGGHGNCRPISTNNLHIHAIIFAKDLYLASVEDRATIGYFLALQLIKELPKKCKSHLWISYLCDSLPNFHQRGIDAK